MVQDLSHSTQFLKELFLLRKGCPWRFLLGLGMDGPHLSTAGLSHQYNPSIELVTRELTSLVWGPGYHL